MMKAAVVVLMAFGALVVGGCSPNRARVECRVMGNNVSCTVSHDQGRGDVNVCWDVDFTCMNGARVMGRACQDVAEGGRAARMITANELQGLAYCNGATAFDVRNVVVTRR